MLTWRKLATFGCVLPFVDWSRGRNVRSQLDSLGCSEGRVVWSAKILSRFIVWNSPSPVSEKGRNAEQGKNDD